MALLGFYVGVIPVTLGMLWLPFVRRVDDALDARPDGAHDRAARLPRDRRDARGRSTSRARAPQAFGGIGARLPRRAPRLSGADRRSTRTARPPRRAGDAGGAAGGQLALLVAIAIGLHNLGEGLAIGSAYAVGALALGAFLVIGFALHNTTEGLGDRRPARRRAARRSAGSPCSGLHRRARPRSSAPGSARRPSTPALAAFLLGAGAGAIVAGHRQQLVPVDPRRRRAARCTPLTRRRASLAGLRRSSTRPSLLVSDLMAARRRAPSAERGDRELRQGDLRARAARRGRRDARTRSPSGSASPPASASGMVKKLDELGLVRHVPYKGVRADADGRAASRSRCCATTGCWSSTSPSRSACRGTACTTRPRCSSTSSRRSSRS